MRGRRRSLLLLCLLGWTSLIGAAEPGHQQVLVISIQDGARLTVADPQGKQARVALAGVCAPAIGQPFGRKSKFSLNDLALLKSVRLIWQAHEIKNDRSAVVMSAGQDLAYLQLQRGMVALDTSTMPQLEPAQQARYNDAQVLAQKQRLGFWGLGVLAPCAQP